MTTPPRLLADRVGNGPISIQRFDKTKYLEHNPATVLSLINAACVEGVGPPSGRILFLRMVVPPEMAIVRIQTITEPQPEEENGSIISAASREIFKQKIRNEKGVGRNWVWCHKACA